MALALPPSHPITRAALHLGGATRIDATPAGGKIIACEMTMDVMGVKQADIVDGVEFGRRQLRGG